MSNKHKEKNSKYLLAKKSLYTRNDKPFSRLTEKK